MRIKICGITQTRDALLAQDAGVWAVGFIFVENTPRYVTPEKAREITDKLSEKTEKVGVFLNSPLDIISKICKLAGITKIQLHGDETPEFCREVNEVTGKDIIKAFRIKQENDISSMVSYKDSASYVLLDTFCETQHGGTGKTFDWKIAKKAQVFGIPLILAGGLTPDNIVKAYQEVKPFALDISSGVEESKGVKSPEKIAKIKALL